MMNITCKGALIGMLALAGSTLAVAEAQAMPVGPVAAPAAEAHVDQVYYYGYRRPFLGRRFFYGYRPYYGYRRFGYGFGPRFGYYGRGFYGRGYGYRRFY